MEKIGNSLNCKSILSEMPPQQALQKWIQGKFYVCGGINWSLAHEKFKFFWKWVSRRIQSQTNATLWVIPYETTLESQLMEKLPIK